MQYNVKLLRKIRLTKGLSPPKLAQISGVNEMTIRRTEQKISSPRPQTVKKLAEALGVEMDRLVQI